MFDPATVDGTEAQERGQAPAYTEITPRKFTAILEECRWQPSWRNMADKCADYYDGNQLDQETLAALDKKGMGPLQRNIIQPLVNVVLGMEAKTRTDWRVSADNDAVQDVAEAMSAKLHEAERETRADRACSDGYAGQVKAGLGWVEVSRTSDPFDYPYRATSVHRREIWWDWRDDSPDAQKGRFKIRKRWFDVDQATAYFPEHRDLLRACVGDPNRYEMIASKRALDLGQSLEDDRGMDIEDYEQWRQFDRQRVALYETWYRCFVRGYVAKLPDGQVIEVDARNPVQKALIMRGAIQPYKAVYSKLRMAMFCGPHKLMDVPVSKRHDPYVPFWGYREDRTGVPYGLVRAMLVPQDEVNARLQKMMWLLGAKRVQMDSDALDSEVQSPADMLAEIARPDAVVFLNPNRTNKQGGFNVDDNLTLSDAQYKVLQDAMQSAQQVVGVFNAMLGRGEGAQSGMAVNSLVEQGTTALAEINDNYRFARRVVGERLLDLVREDMIGQPVDVMVGEQGRKRIISLNQPVQAEPDPQVMQAVQQVQQGIKEGRIDPNGQEAQLAMRATQEEQAKMQMKNDVRTSKLRVALDDVPSSSAYREQQFTMLAELTKGLPPELQAVIAPFIMEASDLRKRREMADALRKQMGVPTPKTPEEEQRMEQQMAEAQAFATEVQRKQALLELAERQAKVDKLNAETRKAISEVEGNPALQGAKGEHAQRVAQIETKARGEIDKLTATLMQVRMESARREQLLLAKLTEAVATLKANAGNKEAEREKAEIERDIAKIEKEKEIAVAQIENDSAKVVESLTKELASLREELLTKLEAETKAREKADADAKERERKEEEKERKQREAKPPAPPAPAPNVSVVVAEGDGGERQVEVTLPDGKKITGTSKRKPKKGGDK